MAAVHVPNYAALPRLPDGSTRSQYVDKLSLNTPPTGVVTTMLRPTDMATTYREQVEGQQGQHLFFCFTVEEFNTLLGASVCPMDHNYERIPGNIRVEGGFTQILGSTTLQDAHHQLCYHLSQGHATTASPNDFVVLSMVVDSTSMGIHSMHGKATWHQRANITTFYQINAPSNYRPTPEERATIIVARMSGMHWTYPFTTMMWSNGWAWVYATHSSVKRDQSPNN